MTKNNPTQINQGGAANQERQPKEQTASKADVGEPAGNYPADKMAEKLRLQATREHQRRK